MRRWHWLHFLRALTLFFLILFFAQPVVGPHSFRSFFLVLDNRPASYPQGRLLLRDFLSKLPKDLSGEVMPLCGEPLLGTAGGLRRARIPPCRRDFSIHLNSSFFPKPSKGRGLFLFSPDPELAPWSGVQVTPPGLFFSARVALPPLLLSQTKFQVLLEPTAYLPEKEVLRGKVEWEGRREEKVLRGQTLFELFSGKPGKKKLTVTLTAKGVQKKFNFPVQVESVIPIYFSKADQALTPLFLALRQEPDFPWAPEWVEHFPKEGGLRVAASPETAEEALQGEKSLIFLQPILSSSEWNRVLSPLSQGVQLDRPVNLPTHFRFSERGGDWLPRIDLSQVILHRHFQLTTALPSLLVHTETGDPALFGDSRALFANFFFSSTSNFYRKKAFVLFFRELVSRFFLLPGQRSLEGLGVRSVAQNLVPKAFFERYKLVPLRLYFLFAAFCLIAFEIFWFWKK